MIGRLAFVVAIIVSAVAAAGRAADPPAPRTSAVFLATSLEFAP